MDKNTHREEKLKLLKSKIKNLDSLIVAFSGGVDSTFLLKTAHDILKNRVIAVTAKSSTFPEREFKQSIDFANSIGAKQIIIQSEELDIEGFSSNPINRCYLCKKELFSKIISIATNLGILNISDGSNIDDLDDYRPGMQAIKELNVLSLLQESFFTKNDIRFFSKQLSLPTWDKPAFACLSSRFPYGQQITKEKLKMVDLSEQYLLDLGFKQVRVRHHGDIARIEVDTSEIHKFFVLDLISSINSKLRELGFTYVSLDLNGYKTGNMNIPILP